jgi:serine/threonine protein kinase
VTPEGRVVILDFGLIAELLPQHAGDVNDAGGGTPGYMASEARSGAPPSEATDWYGVGVTVYEALTGSIPVAGTFLDVLLGTRTGDPRRRRRWCRTCRQS